MAKNKFKGKRMVPEYLITKLEEMDPSGGGDYTAGYGIDITDDKISVDQDVVASKSELNGYIKDNDLNYASTFRGKGVYVKEEGTYTSTSYADGSIERIIPRQPGYSYTLPDKSGTFAMTVDIITSYNDLTDKPTIPAGATNPFLRVTDANDAVFFSLTGAAGSFYQWLEVANESPIYVNLLALNPVYGTGLTSTYNSGSSQLEVAVDTTVVALKSDIPTVPTNVSAFTNDSGYITGITSAMVKAALGYTPGTSSFSGSYNDLTDKPTIPTVNDPTITFTQGGVTKGTISLNQAANQTIALDAGGASPAYEITNMVVDSTNQTITLTITQNN